jgi:hypothetical protein
MDQLRAKALHQSYGTAETPDVSGFIADAKTRAMAQGCMPEMAEEIGQAWGRAMTWISRERRTFVASALRMEAASTLAQYPEAPLPALQLLQTGRLFILPDTIMAGLARAEMGEGASRVEECASRQLLTWIWGLPQAVGEGAMGGVAALNPSALKETPAAQSQLSLHAQHDADLMLELGLGPWTGHALRDPWNARWTLVGDLAGATHPRWLDVQALEILGPPLEGCFGAAVSSGVAMALGGSKAARFLANILPAAAVSAVLPYQGAAIGPPPKILEALKGLDLDANPLLSAIKIAALCRAAGEALGQALVAYPSYSPAHPATTIALRCGDLLALQLALGVWSAPVAGRAGSDASLLHDGQELVAALPLWRIQEAALIALNRLREQYDPPMAMSGADEGNWTYNDVVSSRLFLHAPGMVVQGLSLRPLLPAIAERAREHGGLYTVGILSANPTQTENEVSNSDALSAHIIVAPLSGVEKVLDCTDIIILSDPLGAAQVAGKLAAQNYEHRAVLLSMLPAPHDPLLWAVTAWAQSAAIPSLPTLMTANSGYGANNPVADAALTAAYSLLTSDTDSTPNPLTA